MIVQIPHEGISPEDSERLLVRPMELELKSIEGVVELNGYAAEGMATLVIEFDSSFEPDQAVQDVREAVDRGKVKLPSTAEEPIIREVSASDFPVITVSVAGQDVSERTRLQSARDLKDAIEAVPGVLEAKISGAREEVLEAVIDPVQLQALGISAEELLSSLQRNNRLIAAGNVDTGRGSFAIKIPSVIESAEDILSIPIKANASGVISLRDVVVLSETFKDASSYTRTNGQAAIAIEVSKRAGVSLVDVVAGVREAVELTRLDLPRAVQIDYIADQSPQTIEQISTLQGNISTAMFLVLTVVVAAVGFKSGMLVALGIPFSFLFAFIFVSALGYTYNFMVMFGMLLGLGMLIDGAIVVVELADRKMAGGAPPKAAYLAAARRMFWPICASVGTTPCGVLAAHVLAGRDRPIHALPTRDRVCRFSRLLALCFGVRPGLGRAAQPKPKPKRRPAG